MADSSLYLRQLLGGRDFGRRNPAAGQMQNFVYLLGDTATRECVVVDPAWAVDELCDAVEADGYRLVGALCTHYHPDHVGGTMFGFTVEGLPRLLARSPVPVHVHRLEAAGVRQVTGLSARDLTEHDSGDVVKVGNVEIELLHTPGHTPGSLCFRVRNNLVAGDTLFLQGCGRVDLPGGDRDEMYRTLTQRLGSLPGDMVLYPGHAYGGAHAPLEEVRRSNPYLRVPSLEAWRRAMG
jgi:hydroxyacylglutathione hydrolase